MVESPFAPLPTFLSGERKVYKRSAFSAPRALRRGDASRKAADGFRQIGERFADLFRKFLLKALFGCSRAELVRALRRPTEGGRLDRFDTAAWHSRFEARMREGIMQGAFGGLPKGLCAVKE